MIYVEIETMAGEKADGHTRGSDYAVCNGNPNKFTATTRKEYEAKEKDMNYQTGLTERMPL